MTEVSNLTAKQNQASVLDGTVLSPGGVNTSANGANVLTALGVGNAVATALSDDTRDYMVYLEITTSGTAFTLSLINVTGEQIIQIMQSESVTAGQLITFRLPAGWSFVWSGTTVAIATQTAISC